MSKHTPGPWFYESGYVCAEMYRERRQIERPSIVHVWDTISSDEAVGNALLIAAAPELLKACEAALPHHQGGHSEVGRLLRAAIAKAGGKS